MIDEEEYEQKVVKFRLALVHLITKEFTDLCVLDLMTELLVAVTSAATTFGIEEEDVALGLSKLFQVVTVTLEDAKKSGINFATEVAEA